MPGTLTTTANTVKAIVNPHEAATNYWVQYGTTTEYGSSTTASAVTNTEGEQSEVVAMHDLRPCTTYHYQAEAENEANEGEPSLGGDKTFTTECTPPAITEIARGWSHTCELLREGSIECWGNNAEGQLGDGTTTSSSTPVPVSGITNAISVTAGLNYTCATLSEGSVECWGGGASGQLGNGTSKGSTTPVRVDGIAHAVAVTAAGEVHACAVASGGRVECWGANGVGQAPGLVEGLSGPAVGGGGGIDFTCALLSSGRVECWGENSVGQLGNGTTMNSSPPVRVSGIATATSVTAAGSGFACASLSDGSVECWGNKRLTPAPVSGITNATAVSAGEEFACALLSSGGVYCFPEGDNFTPGLVSGITEATAISASGSEACAIIAGSSVQCWSEESSGGGGGGGGGGGLT